MGEYTVSGVCVLVVILWWMTLRRRIRGRYLLWFESETSLHSVGVCVCCICVFTPVLDRKPVLQGTQKNSSSLIQLPQQAELGGGDGRGGGQQEARGQHGLLHAGFLTQVWTKRPINSEMCTYKLDFTFFIFFPFNVSKLFPHVFLQLAPLKWYLIPHVSELICPKFSLQEIASQFFFSR